MPRRARADLAWPRSSGEEASGNRSSTTPNHGKGHARHHHHHRRPHRQADHRPDQRRRVPVVGAAGARPRPPHVRPGVPVDRGVLSRRSPTSTATPASCATAATRSSSWPSSRPTSRSPTCCSTASCPTAEQLEQWTHDITHHTFIHENMRKRFMEGFHYDAHPMGMLVSARRRAVDLLPRGQGHLRRRRSATSRSCGSSPRCRRWPRAATASASGMPFVYPDNTLDFPANFLNMMWKVGDDYEVDPVLARALDVLFILHADHEQNCGTTAMRVVGSAHADPYSAARRGRGRALRPAATAAPTSRSSACSPRSARSTTSPAFIEDVKAGKGRLHGLRPPRLQELRPAGDDHQADRRRGVRGHRQEPAARHRARSSKRSALSDDYFISRKLYPNVDFYSGLIYQAMGFPIEMFTVLFAIPRTSGWLAHWQELLDDRTRRSPGPASSTSAPASATTWRSTSGPERFLNPGSAGGSQDPPRIRGGAAQPARASMAGRARQRRTR